MNYITAASIGLNFTIPAVQYANATLTQYHLEVHCLATGVRKNVAAATVTAAIAPVEGVNAGTPGLVTFTSVPTASLGAYTFKVFYEDNADLDTAGMTCVGRVTAHRVTVITTVLA